MRNHKLFALSLVFAFGIGLIALSDAMRNSVNKEDSILEYTSEIDRELMWDYRHLLQNATFWSMYTAPEVADLDKIEDELRLTTSDRRIIVAILSSQRCDVWRLIRLYKIALSSNSPLQNSDKKKLLQLKAQWSRWPLQISNESAVLYFRSWLSEVDPGLEKTFFNHIIETKPIWDKIKGNITHAWLEELSANSSSKILDDALLDGQFLAFYCNPDYVEHLIYRQFQKTTDLDAQRLVLYLFRYMKEEAFYTLVAELIDQLQTGEIESYAVDIFSADYFRKGVFEARQDSVKHNDIVNFFKRINSKDAQ